MEQRYLERNAPDWSIVKVSALRDRKSQWRAYAALALSVLVLAATGAALGWLGAALSLAIHLRRPG